MRASSEAEEALAAEIQGIAERHLEALFEQIEEVDDEDGTGVAAFAPFCGCVTCIVREVLLVTAEKVEQLVFLSNKLDRETNWWKPQS